MFQTLNTLNAYFVQDGGHKHQISIMSASGGFVTIGATR